MSLIAAKFKKSRAYNFFYVQYKHVLCIVYCIYIIMIYSVKLSLEKCIQYMSVNRNISAFVCFLDTGVWPY